jgi:hypothetical protein
METGRKTSQRRPSAQSLPSAPEGVLDPLTRLDGIPYRQNKNTGPGGRLTRTRLDGIRYRHAPRGRRRGVLWYLTPLNEYFTAIKPIGEVTLSYLTLLNGILYAEQPLWGGGGAPT